MYRVRGYRQQNIEKLGQNLVPVVMDRGDSGVCILINRVQSRAFLCVRKSRCCIFKRSSKQTIQLTQSRLRISKTFSDISTAPFLNKFCFIKATKKNLGFKFIFNIVLKKILVSIKHSPGHSSRPLLLYYLLVHFQRFLV